MATVDEKDPTLLVVQELRKSIGKEMELPPTNSSESYRRERRRHRGAGGYRDPDAMTEIEQKTRWFTSSWQSIPEVGQYRDMHLLFRLSMESGTSFKQRNPAYPVR